MFGQSRSWVVPAHAKSNRQTPGNSQSTKTIGTDGYGETLSFIFLANVFYQTQNGAARRRVSTFLSKPPKNFGRAPQKGKIRTRPPSPPPNPGAFPTTCRTPPFASTLPTPSKARSGPALRRRNLRLRFPPRRGGNSWRRDARWRKFGAR